MNSKDTLDVTEADLTSDAGSSSSGSPSSESSSSRALAISSAFRRLGSQDWRRKAYRNQVNIDFARLWRRSLLVSLVLVLISAGSFLLRGFNLGIEFEGGVSWELTSSETSTEAIRDALRPVGMADARIQSLGGDIFRIRAEVSETNLEEIRGVSQILSELDGVNEGDISYSAVGPSWGSEITRAMRTALIVFFILIAFYIWLRLEWRMTLAALVAVLHDIAVTVGFYALFQLEVTPATVIAFLTILGYSLYDTLVVFDKIKENESRLSASRRHTYNQLVVSATNQVLMRSVNTTITSILPVLSLLILGGFLLGAVALQEFAVALLVGMVAGTYSSLFVATPITARLKEREPHWVEVRARLSQHGLAEPASGTAKSSADIPIAATSPASFRKAPSPEKKRSVTSQSRVRTARTHPPRPRKKKK